MASYFELLSSCCTQSQCLDAFLALLCFLTGLICHLAPLYMHADTQYCLH